MAIAERRAEVVEQVVGGAPPLTTHGFRPASRRRARIAAGAALAAIALGGNVLLYSALGDAAEVVQVVRDVPAGARITTDDIRLVEVGADASVRTIEGDDVDQVVGQYAKVRIVSGSLVVREALQSKPLVSPGSAIVAVQIPESGIPEGLRERSRVQLVVPNADPDEAPPTVIEARVVARPLQSDGITGSIALSVEVVATDAPALAAADDVRVVLLEPFPDPAVTQESTG